MLQEDASVRLGGLLDRVVCNVIRRYMRMSPESVFEVVYLKIENDIDM